MRILICLVKIAYHCIISRPHHQITVELCICGEICVSLWHHINIPISFLFLKPPLRGTQFILLYLMDSFLFPVCGLWLALSLINLALGREAFSDSVEVSWLPASAEATENELVLIRNELKEWFFIDWRSVLATEAGHNAWLA